MSSKIGFFQDAPDSNSIMRLMFAIGLIWSMIMTTGLAIFTKATTFELIGYFTATSGVFIGLKIAQNYQEKEPKEKKPAEVIE